MLKVFVKTNCIGSKKAEEFLKKNGISYDRFNLSFIPMNEDDLYWMYKITESLEEIINPNSEEFLKDETLKERMGHLTLKEKVSLLIEKPDLFSYPMALQFDSHSNAKNLIIGFVDSQWEKLAVEPDYHKYYYNANKSYIFKTCCFYDEAKNDEINLFKLNKE